MYSRLFKFQRDHTFTLLRHEIHTYIAMYAQLLKNHFSHFLLQKDTRIAKLFVHETAKVIKACQFYICNA